MEFSEEELQQIFKIFKDEAEEHLGNINRCLLDLEKNPDNRNLISELFREAHTIKGSARMLDVVSIQNLAHKMEDLLGLANEGGTKVTSEFIDLLCQGVDLIIQILNKLSYNTLDYYDENSDKLAQKIEDFKNELSGNNSVQEEPVIAETQQNNDIADKDNISETPPDNDITNNDNISGDDQNDTEKPKFQDVLDADFKPLNNTSNEVVLINNEANKQNILDNSTTFLGILSHYTSQLDNKYQKNNSIDEILSIINDSLKTQLPDLKHEILKLISINLVYIKDNNIIPSTDVITAIEQALGSVYNPNGNEDLNLVVQRLNILKQMLELSKENEQLLVVSKNSQLQNNSQPTNKNNTEQQINPTYDTNLFKTLRVDTQKLDKLESYVEELIVLKIKNKQQLKDLSSIITDLSEIQKNLWKFPANSKSADKKIFSQQLLADKFITSKNIQNQIDKISEKADDLYHSLDLFQKSFLNDDIRLNFLTDEIENMVKSIRILPLATVFHMFPRMVRDIARTQGKQVDIIITGSEASADKTIVEEIKAPLIHIIRNAVDHGIEEPAERIEKGKNPTGKILLNSYHSGNSITIEVIDDGRGLNIDKIKEKALKQNLLSYEELSQLSETQVMNLIFWPGFSTEDSVTEISGRGVGLDVVHTKISQLDGKVSIQSNSGRGFKIVIKIPITLATLKALLVKVNNQIFAISSTYVKTVTSLRKDEIFMKEGKSHISYNGNSIKLVKLTELLNIPENNEILSERHNIIVVQVEDSILAIEVAEFIKTEEILQKKLNPPLTKVKNISGVSSLSTGEACLILNMNDIIKSALSNSELQRKSTVLTLPDKQSKIANV